MCGRFALHADSATLAAEFGVIVPAAYAPRYNIAPSQAVLALREADGHRAATLLQWGLVPGWTKDPRSGPRPINARAETVAAKPSFRAAFRHRRCVVPASGYYEWRAGAGGKQPYYIHPAHDACFAFAALWEHWERDGSVLETCALLTCAANRALARVHDRMPVVLDRAGCAAWLAPTTPSTDLAPLLLPAPDDATVFHAVSRRVNSPRHDDPACLEAVLDDTA